MDTTMGTIMGTTMGTRMRSASEPAGGILPIPLFAR